MMTKLGDDETFAKQVAGAIRDGEFDRWLELILEAAHNRKRALRGTPGFRRSDR